MMASFFYACCQQTSSSCELTSVGTKQQPVASRKAVAAESPEENIVWCTPGGQILYLSHKQRILDQIKNGWVDDAIATAAMKLLKEEHPEIGGLRPTNFFYGQSRISSKKQSFQLKKLRFAVFQNDFLPPDERQMQILYTGDLHWVLVSNYHQFERELVFVFDSLENRLTNFLVEKIAAVFRFEKNEFRIVWPVVDQQKNNKDCGIFAIAFLVALCHRFDPTSLRFESSMKLREHLVRCFEEGSFSLGELFPTRTEGTEETNDVRFSLPGKLFSFLSENAAAVRRRIVLRERKVGVICRCRMPSGRRPSGRRKDKTVVCSNGFCSTRFFHESCVRIFDAVVFSTQRKIWACPQCRDLLLSSWIPGFLDSRVPGFPGS